MQHYLVYNTNQNLFLRASADNEGFLTAYDLVEHVDDATIFTCENIGYHNFEESHNVIDIINFLKGISDDFEAFIFCACAINYNHLAITITRIDYINPLINCKHVDSRIGEKIIFK